MNASLLFLATIQVLALSAACTAGKAAADSTAPLAAAPDACPLPCDWRQALAACARMQWQRATGDGRYSTVPIAEADATVVRDLLLFKTQTACARDNKAPDRKFEERLHLLLQDAKGNTICSIPMCYFAPESDARNGVFQFSRYAMSNEDYTTLYRIMLRPEVIAEVPQGMAPERQELIRRYNLGKDRYCAQTHVMTYRLVSGKEILGSCPRGAMRNTCDPPIDPGRTYGIACIIKPRNEPLLGGGDLRVIYDPATGAILSGGKSK